MMDRLNAMAAFVRVVETGSFSAAAREFGIGQPAVSKIVAQLEERLGVQLLLRSSRQLTPTDAGRIYYDRAKIAVESVDDADAAARGAGTRLAGRLRIAAPVTFARMQIIPHLGSFLGAHPDLQVEMILDDRNIDLIENGVDLSLRLGSLQDSTLVARKIGQSARRVFGSAVYLARRGEPRKPSDLLGHDVVVYGRLGDRQPQAFVSGDNKQSITLAGRLHVTAVEGMRTAVIAGLGLAVATDWIFGPDVEAGSVRAVLPRWSLPPVSLWAVLPSGTRTGSKAKAFLSFLESQMEQNTHQASRYAAASRLARRAGQTRKGE
jgi:DNA-binding transcriptional LysR family regulator